MGTDNIFHRRKARQATSHQRERARRAQHERVLIVCEGEKTEPNYFKGLRAALAINAMNVIIADKKRGLDPNRLVEYALEEYRKDSDFEHVFCVFDRDKHATYDAAMDKIRRTRMRKGTKLHPITSIPCFEIWLLLHFTYTTRSFCAAADDSNCALVMSDLEKYMPGYEKGAKDVFMGDERLETASNHAKQLEEFHKTSGTDNPSTRIYRLVEYLRGLKR
ncbi:MAG: RloB family protein [Syntrophus sp. (in: bacteria)]